MTKSISVIAAAALAGMTVASVTGMSAARAQTAQGPAETPLPSSAVPFTARAQTVSAVAGSRRLTIEVWLTPRTSAAEGYAAQASTPGSPLFQHYLSPAAYAARFGAAPAEAAGVEKWLRSAGFTGVSPDAQRDYVRATAPVSTIDSAFKTQLRYYRPSAGVSAGRYELRANAQPVSVPAGLASSVLGVTGLDNASPVQTYTRPAASASAARAASSKAIVFPCSSYYGQHYVDGHLPKRYGTVDFPTVGCGYSARQIRGANGYSASNTGKGETIALVEVGLTPDMFLTLQDYAKANQIQAPSSTRYEELAIGQGSACGDPFNIEEQIDVEASYDMAPGATQIVVGGDSCDNGDYGLQALFNADTAILNGAGGHPLASVASNSWEGFDETQPANLVNIEHAYLVRAAAEGVGMYFSTGDTSGVETPSSDPYATAVGGTTLGIGNTSQRLFETGWSTDGLQDVNNAYVDLGEVGAAGGGPSLLWAQPGYQRGVVPASLARAPGNRGGLVRALPDISADADPFTGLAVGLLSFNNQGVPTGYSETPYGGTSLAAPLVAGMVTAAEQGQHRTFGFLDPALYRLAGTSAVNDVLPLTAKTPSRYRGVACDVNQCGVLLLTQFDDQSYGMSGYTGQVTAKEYDTMSGIGSPAGQRFITALRRLEG
jgi:subtilase family serine protease